MMDVFVDTGPGDVGGRCALCSGSDCSLRGFPLNGTIRRRAVERGARIETSGGPDFCMAVVSSGLAAATSVMPDGRRQIMCLYTPGDAICPLGPRDAESWAEALTATDLCEVSLGPVSGIDTLDPDHLRRFFELAHARLERLSAHAILLGRMDGTERLCAFLHDMALRIGQIEGQRCTLTLPMSREDIADYLGLNSETVSRILSRIRKAGLVRFHSPTQCEIDDLDRLAARAPFTRSAPTLQLDRRQDSGRDRSACPFPRIPEEVA